MMLLHGLWSWATASRRIFYDQQHALVVLQDKHDEAIRLIESTPAESTPSADIVYDEGRHKRVEGSNIFFDVAIRNCESFTLQDARLTIDDIAVTDSRGSKRKRTEYISEKCGLPLVAKGDAAIPPKGAYAINPAASKDDEFVFQVAFTYKGADYFDVLHASCRQDDPTRFDPHRYVPSGRYRIVLKFEAHDIRPVRKTATISVSKTRNTFSLE